MNEWWVSLYFSYNQCGTVKSGHYLKEYLVTSFYDMNQKILTKTTTYFQNFSWFQFYVYKLCMIVCIGIAP